MNRLELENMKRNMDLIRKLLFKIEKDSPRIGHLLSVDGYTDKEINHHLQLMGEAGFIETVHNTKHHYNCFLFNRLTNHGIEFLNLIRDDNIWAEIVRLMDEQNQSLPCFMYEDIVKKIKNKQVNN